MGRIARLSSALASQIAAGEVVERPASALKELIENSLDAGATRCDIEIEGGGITRLSIRDDGSGMDREDASLCVERHATSKLQTFEHLTRIPTFGFRGEALPSIASVSRFTLLTRTADSDVGTKVVVEGGESPRISDVGIPVGTQIDVCDLFYNVPARRKFLRSTGTEAGHITEVVEAAALSAPETTFTLTRDGRKAREWLRGQDRGERVAALMPGEDLACCLGERGPLRVEAYLGRPERARAGAGALKLFCNSRPVRDRAVLHTVAQAYGSILERGRYPRGVVYLDLPPELVDVNVHPQKSEVRFADGRAVTDALYEIISSQLSKAFSLPSPVGNRWKPRADAGNGNWVRGGHGRTPRTGQDAGAGSGSGVTPTDAQREDADDRVSEVAPLSRRDGTEPDAEFQETLSAPSDADTSEESTSGTRSAVFLDGAPHRPKQQSFMRIHEEGPTPAARLPESDSDVGWEKLRFVAQVRGTYLICEGPEGLFVLDQHAAAERVNFHRLKQEYSQRKMPSQALLFPVALEVSVEQAELIETRAEEIQRLGFDVRVHGETKVSVHRVPQLLQRDSTERLLRELLAELQRTGRGFTDAIDSALATIACHGSIRAGDALRPERANALLKALSDVDFAGHCPHGRPIVTFTSWSELERKVGRR